MNTLYMEPVEIFRYDHGARMVVECILRNEYRIIKRFRWYFEVPLHQSELFDRADISVDAQRVLLINNMFLQPDDEGTYW